MQCLSNALCVLSESFGTINIMLPVRIPSLGEAGLALAELSTWETVTEYSSHYLPMNKLLLN
jgi:hypothetical protein